MDLTLSEEQELIQSAVRDFLDNECTTAHVRAMEEDSRGYSPELWKLMTDLGWMGMSFPERFGGAGMSFQDLCLVIEEQGRFRLPGPFFHTIVLCGLPIARFGSEAQKIEYLAAIAAGERIMAYAATEPGATWGPTQVGLTATAVPGGYRLDGAKLFVPYAHVADDLLVLASNGGQGEHEVKLFLVDARTSGISFEPLRTIASDHQQKITFEGVKVTEGNVLGEVGKDRAIIKAINEWGAAAKCAEMIGGAQKVLEMTLEYAGQRQQFGRPIGSFQAIQHHCANMAVDVLGSRFITYEAIWQVSEYLEASHEVSMAKAWVSDAYQRVCALGHQIHGAIGFTREHDMQLFSRHAMAASLAFGDGDYHREQIARQLDL